MNMRVDSLEVANHHLVGLEIGKDELKKQSDQAKRLGNDSFKGHAKAGSAQNAVQSLQPEQLLAVLKNTEKALMGHGGKTAISDQEKPTLQAPQSGNQKSAASNSSQQSSASMLTELLGKITQLTANTSLEKMLSQLNSFNMMMAGAIATYSAMAVLLELQGTQWASDSDALKAAQQEADGLSSNVDAAQSALDSAQAALDALKQQAAGQDPVPEALQKQIDKAQTAVTNAQITLTAATNIYNSFVEKTLNPAKTAESNSRIALEATQAKSQALVGSLTPQQQTAAEFHRKQSDEQAKSLNFLMALMSQLISKSSNDDLQASAELKQKLAEASAKDAEKKAKEYEEEVRKAEEMQKTMGCIGKILGWLITAVSFVAAAFTGGASLALAAVGLALAIGDEISQAVSGKSFMADAMQPLMDAIVKPLMELMGKMFAGILEAMGVDKETAEMVGKIMGAIAAAAVLVAGVVVAGSALSKVFGVVMKKIGMEVGEEASKTMGKSIAAEVEKEVVQDLAKTTMRTAAKEVSEEVAKEVTEQATKSTLQRLMDSAVGQVFKRMSQGFGRTLGKSDEQMQLIYNRTQMAVTGAAVVNTSIQVAGSIIVADMMVEAAKTRGELMKSAALQDLLNEMMNRAIDTFTHRMETVNQIVKNISAVADTQLQAGKYITKQMSSVAG
ncbi:type III secretion system translocon subunit SctE [Kluyvera intermedia]|uniref:YopB/SseC family type III secretion system translocon subunit n=1 Tax=Kluyvera intermedia TaxID=61648 RepID=A0ABX6DQK8_KLUIN|nr:type III secretion system translocon subunit SctE [Kluyvera intermedia]QGH29860.1 YopB/SseC family type III secretion system translocon subunit [Kluyvera intermedia]QGH38842.1 YopB/SseC family type III secretion system translocon subunit [Kluyvera intermedia]